MRKRLLWVCLVLCLSCGLAYADGIDPVMQVNDPKCIESCGTQVGGQTGGDPFFFNSNSPQPDGTGGGGGSFAFHINVLVNTLDIQTPGTFDSTTLVNCTSNVFFCRVSFIDGVTDMYFTADCSTCGIPPTDFFTIVLNDNGLFDANGSGGWGFDRLFRAQANLTSAPTTSLVPEPSSLLLFGVGAAALAGRWKIRRRNG